MNFFKNIFKSIFIGAGAVAPGVSGGALAIVLGLYEKILEAINHLFKDIKNHGQFLISIGIGAAIGVVIFSSIQLVLIDKFPMQTMYSFTGLVVGTIPVLFKTATKKGYSHKLFIPFLITLVIAITFTIVDNSSLKDNLETTGIEMNILNFFILILIGFVMSGSLVIPGISGTVLLFLLGVYGLVMNAVASVKDILLSPSVELITELMYILIPLGIGLAMGAFLFSKLMDYLLKNLYSITYFAILGFVIGSLPELVLGLEYHLATPKTIVLSVILFLISLLVSLKVNKLAKD